MRPKILQYAVIVTYLKVNVMTSYISYAVTVEADPCTISGSNPCHNGGACKKGTSLVFSCTCAAGWTGKDCSAGLFAPHFNKL